ncbi:Cytochrome P450 superfamily [Arabidopsis suecica]|uniref:Cytochrome P450 superfamily n=1 Tax=Arabidopsis suecica TaxID=45249 RepID=A0A8T1XX11_ARASU|nr:Cytochrome P450 superfamily [Arabidopsis suecica]
MASISLVGVSIAIICFLILHRFLIKKPPYRFYIISWPVLGMIPGLFLVLHRIYDFTVEFLESTELTFSFKGPWFAGLDMLVTADPANIHYLVNSNFSNFVKGSDFKEVFDAFEEGLFAKDSLEWKDLNKATQVMINHQGFQRLSMSTTRSKIKDGLVPLFNHIAEEGTTVDLQDVFLRFTFDTSLVTVTGCDDPRSLSIEMPEVEFAKALDNTVEGIQYRHVKPRFLWKLQNWIGVGIEKKMIEAGAIFDRVCAKYISARRNHFTGESEDLLTSHIYIFIYTTKYPLLNPNNDRFLRDNVLALLLAGRNTTASALTWFFWLLSENPTMVTKICQEIDKILPRSSSGKERPSYDPMEYLNKLVYLHAALCESMRLYPPVPIERVSPVESDVLPSGHKVEANSKILIFTYAVVG